MKFQIMIIIEILYLLANVLVINSSDVMQNKSISSKITIGADNWSNKFGQDCNNLIKGIRDNKLADFVLDCPEARKNSTFPENVRQDACHVSRNMLQVVCKEKVNETLLSSLGRKNINNICPFNFSHLEHSNVFEGHETVKQLTVHNFCQEARSLSLPNEKQANHTVINLEKSGQTAIRLPSQQMQESQFQQVELSGNKVEKVNSNTIMGSDSYLAEPAEKKEKDISTDMNEEVLGSLMTEPLKKKAEELRKNEKGEEIESPVTQLEENKSKKPKTNLKEETPGSIDAESEHTFSAKDEKTNKPVLISTSKELKITETAELQKINIKEQDMENGMKNSKAEERLPEEDLADEDINSQQLDDAAFSKDFNPDLNPQQVLSSSKEKTAFETKKETFIGEEFSQAEDSHFFFYFIMVSSVVVVGYLAFHNKNKILAFALEGSSSRRSRRRPNPARYRKLETTLEDVLISSGTNATAPSNVHY